MTRVARASRTGAPGRGSPSPAKARGRASRPPGARAETSLHHGRVPRHRVFRAGRSPLRSVAGCCLAAVVVAGVLLGLFEAGGRATPASQASVTCSTAVQNASAGGRMGIEQSVAVDPTNADNV